MKLFIKYMVSHRCEMLVNTEMIKLGIPFDIIDVGLIETLEDISDEKRGMLKARLALAGLELLDDKRLMLIQKIKSAIVDMVHQAEGLAPMSYSDYLSEKIGMQYSDLSGIFSQMQGITIQQYIINFKIEKAKELLLYNNLNLTEISQRLNYSSVAHLSNQFKKVTGLTPSYYKKAREDRQAHRETPPQ